MKQGLLLIILFICSLSLNAQHNTFLIKCDGEWVGKLHIYNEGELKDSIPANMFIQYDSLQNNWIWRTTFVAGQDTIIKDYRLHAADSVNYAYNLDEQNGIILPCYLIYNKLHSDFNLNGTLFFSSYSFKGDHLCFEISVNKLIVKSNGQEVKTYNTSTVQYAEFKRIK